MINNNAAVELVHVVNPSGGSGESYTAGTGITISDQNEIGIDQSVVATKAYVTQEVGTVREVPDTSSSDSGKVLGVTDSEGTLGWVANGGGSSYTAGTGIDISAQNEISVDTTVIATQNDISGLQGELTAGTGIDINNDTISVDTTVVATQTDLSGIEQVPTVTSTDDGKVLTASYSGGTGSFAWATPSGGSSNEFVWEAGTTTNQEVYDAIAAGKDIFIHAVESGDNVVYRVYQYKLSDGTYFVYSSRFSHYGGTGNTGCMVQCIAYVPQNNNVANYKSQMNVSFITDKTDTYDSTSKKAMSGIAVASAISGVTLASLNTAGITDIQQVAALPANPVATVLYLIPEA